MLCLPAGDFNGMLGSANWDQIEDATAAIETALGDGKPNKSTELIGKYQTARQFVPLIKRGGSFSGAANAASLSCAWWISCASCRMRTNAACQTIRQPDNPPAGFIRKVWRPFVTPKQGVVSRQAYELCVFFELRDRLRAGGCLDGRKSAAPQL